MSKVKKVWTIALLVSIIAAASASLHGVYAAWQGCVNPPSPSLPVARYGQVTSYASANCGTQVSPRMKIVVDVYNCTTGAKQTRTLIKDNTSSIAATSPAIVWNTTHKYQTRVSFYPYWGVDPTNLYAETTCQTIK